MLRSTGTDSSTSFDGCLVEDGMEGGGIEDMGEKTESERAGNAVFKPKRDSLGNGVDTLIWTNSLSTSP
jgi:hypothetical protein